MHFRIDNFLFTVYLCNLFWDRHENSLDAGMVQKSE